MERNVTTRVLWCCAAATALVVWGLAAPPASANTVGFTIGFGDIALYEPFESIPSVVIDVSNAVSCSESNVLTSSGLSGSGSLDGTTTVVTPVFDPLGQPTDYLASVDATIEGSYGSGNVAVDHVVEIELREHGATPCSASGPVVCTVESANLFGAGRIWSSTLPSLATGDEVWSGAANGDFENYVSGSDCGWWPLVDAGSARFDLGLFVS